jgi:hypothetical protein
MSRPYLALLPLDAIRPTEEILPERVAEVVAMIRTRDAWTQPIAVETSSLALLDGHHRLAAARILGFARVPVRLFDYREVELTSWRPDYAPTPAEVIARARSGQLYPHKTTRHRFPLTPSVEIPLTSLLGMVEPHAAYATDMACGPLERRAEA